MHVHACTGCTFDVWPPAVAKGVLDALEEGVQVLVGVALLVGGEALAVKVAEGEAVPVRTCHARAMHA